MGFIIIGFLIGAIDFLVSREGKSNPFKEIITFTLLILGVSAILIGLFVPTGEFGPMEEVQTVEIKSLIDNPIMFDCEKNKIDFFVVEEDDCKNPRLVEYCQKANITFWSFGLVGRKTTFVLYIPKGNSLQE